MWVSKSRDGPKELDHHLYSLSNRFLPGASEELHSVIIILTKSNTARKSHFSGMATPLCLLVSQGSQGEEKPVQKGSYAPL